MKPRIVLLVLLFSVISIKNFAQSNIGEIRVSDKYTVTLMFAEPVEFVIWGQNPVISITDGIPVYQNYEQFQRDKTLTIKAKRSGLEKSSITIKTTDGIIYYGFIINEVDEKLFYDFSDQVSVSTKVEKTSISNSGETTKTEENMEKDEPERMKKNSEQEFEEKLSLLMKKPIEYSNFGLVANKLLFSVTNIMNDKENMYLKVIINNKSGNTFIVNSVIFKYVEGKTKGIKRRVVANEERLMPVFSKTVKMVAAYSQEYLGYVLPLYSTGSDGRLLIQFIEEKGTRNYQIEIPAKDMLKIKNF
jgi:hypothetical protein